MPGPSVSHGTEAPQFPGQAKKETPTRSTHDLQGGPDLAPSSRPPRSELPPELLEAISSEAVGRRVEAVASLVGCSMLLPARQPSRSGRSYSS